MYTSMPNCKTNSVINSAFTCNDITTNIISYLPKTQQVKSCMLVSIFWRDIVNTFPLTMRIEDRNKHQIWQYDPILNIGSDESLNNEVHCPLYSIDVLPPSVRRKVTKLTLVLRLVKKHAHRYNLDSIRNLFEGFSKLEDLTIISELYRFDVLNHTLPSLKKFKAGCRYFDNIESLVSVAPNLEHINIPFLHCYDLGHLLSLSGSLQKIQTSEIILLNGAFNESNDVGVNPLVDGFIEQMLPSLISWQIGKCYGQEGLLKTCHHHPGLLDSTAKFEFVYPNSRELVRQTEPFIILLEVIIRSFLDLKKESKEEEKTRAVTMLQNALSLPCVQCYAKTIPGHICVQNIGNNDVRLVILKEIKRIYRERRTRYYRQIWRYPLRQPWRESSRHSWIQSSVLRLLTAPKRRQQQHKLSKFQQQNTHSFKEEVGPSGAVIRNYTSTLGLSSYYNAVFFD